MELSKFIRPVSKNNKQIDSNVVNKAYKKTPIEKRKNSFIIELGPCKSIFDAEPLKDGAKRNKVTSKQNQD